MPNENDRSRSNRESKPLPWFKLDAAELLTGKGVARAFGDDLGAGALFRFLMHAYRQGSIHESELEAICGAGHAILRPCLERDDDGNLTLPYMNRLIEESDRHRQAKSAAGKVSANTRQHVSTGVDSSQQVSTGVNQKRRGEKKRVQPEIQNSALTRGPSTEPESKKSGGTPSTRHWDAEWGRTRPVAWSWQPKDFAALGKCLELAGGSHEEVCRRITILLESKDGFHIKAASPGLLLSQWSNLGFEVHTVSKGDAQILEIMRQATQPRGSIFDLSQPLPGEVLS